MFAKCEHGCQSIIIAQARRELWLPLRAELSVCWAPTEASVVLREAAAAFWLCQAKQGFPLFLLPTVLGDQGGSDSADMHFQAGHELQLLCESDLGAQQVWAAFLPLLFS